MARIGLPEHSVGPAGGRARTALAAVGALGGLIAVGAYNGLLSTQEPEAGRMWALTLLAAVGGLALSSLGWLAALLGPGPSPPGSEGSSARRRGPISIAVVGAAAGALFWARLSGVGDTALPSIAALWETTLIVAALALGAATAHWLDVAGGRLGAAGLVLLAPVLVAGAALSPTAGKIFPLKNLTAFPGWLAGPFAGLGPALGSDQFHSLVLVLFLCYLAVVALPGSVGVRLGVATVVFLHAVFLLGPPLLSGDVFSYLAYARAGALLGVSPYGGGPPDSAFATGLDVPSAYGPLFTLLSYGVAPLGTASGYWALKVASAAGSLAALALLWRCAELRRTDPLTAVLFAGVNPVLLVYGVGGAHNELLMAPLLVGSILLTLAGRDGAGAAAMVAATAIKLSAGIVAPFQVLGAGERVRALAGAGVALVVLAAVSLAAFGSTALGFLGALVTVSGRGSGYSVLGELGFLLGLEGATPALAAVAAVAFAAVLLGLLVHTFRGADWVTGAGWATLAALLASSYLMPWYLAGLLPLAALSESRSLRWSVLALSALLLWRLPS